MSTINTAVSFVKEVVSRLTGDQSQVIAEKNYRKASSAVSGQIQALKSQLVDDETAVDDAKEALQNAKYPTTPISSGAAANSSYLAEIKRRQDSLDDSIATAEATKKSIAYFEALEKEFNS